LIEFNKPLKDFKKMDTINRSDYSALDTITMILKTLHNDRNPSVSDYDWAIKMIEHEVNQTGRTF